MLGPMPRCVTLPIHGAVEATAWRGQEGRSDVRNLLGHLQEARLDYYELRHVERGEASAASLGMDGVPADDGPQTARTHRSSGPGALRFLLAAPARGAGATALATAVAQLLAQEGESCGVIDLSLTGDMLRRLGVASPRGCSDRCAGLHVSAEAGALRYAAAGCSRTQSVSPVAGGTGSLGCWIAVSSCWMSRRR